MTKRVINLLLMIFLVLTFSPVIALGEEFATVSGVRYELCSYTATATVVDKPGGYQGEVYIPPFITHNGDGYMVTGIGNGAFDGCVDMTFVYIPETIYCIGEYAFRLCYGLSEIMIPDSVESIGNGAFYGCFSLRYMHFGKNSKLQHVGDRAFCDCWRLCHVQLPQSIEFMGKAVFEPSEPLFLGSDMPPQIPPSELEDDVFESPKDTPESPVSPIFPESPTSPTSPTSTNPLERSFNTLSLRRLFRNKR